MSGDVAPEHVAERQVFERGRGLGAASMIFVVTRAVAEKEERIPDRRTVRIGEMSFELVRVEVAEKRLETVVGREHRKHLVADRRHLRFEDRSNRLCVQP